MTDCSFGIFVSIRTGVIARDLNFGYIPTLQRFGTNISEQCASAAESQIRLAAHHEIVDKVISIFSSRGRQNVVLTGPNGSGRSTIVDAVASTLMDADAPIPSSLKYRLAHFCRQRPRRDGNSHDAYFE